MPRCILGAAAAPGIASRWGFKVTRRILSDDDYNPMSSASGGEIGVSLNLVIIRGLLCINSGGLVCEGEMFCNVWLIQSRDDWDLIFN